MVGLDREENRWWMDGVGFSRTVVSVLDSREPRALFFFEMDG